MSDLEDEGCPVRWPVGHTCALLEGHTGLHVSEQCHADTDRGHMRAHLTAGPDQRGADGCTGLWPYTGRAGMTGEGTEKFYRSVWDWRDPGATETMPDEFARMAEIVGHDCVIR